MKTEKLKAEILKAEIRERPILMSGAMVRAILAGAKTQTRRVVKGSTEFKGPYNPAYLEAHRAATGWANICPYGKPGDRLWVKETFAFATGRSRDETEAEWLSLKPLIYRATWEVKNPEMPLEGIWKPSIFMRRAYSRITLEIVSVRVERLQFICKSEAMAEGIHRFEVNGCEYFHWRKTAPTEEHFNSAVMAYRDLWESINGAGSWALNPWVWVVEFKRVNTDAAQRVPTEEGGRA